jgi:hypothetical protein
MNSGRERGNPEEHAGADTTMIQWLSIRSMRMRSAVVAAQHGAGADAAARRARSVRFWQLDLARMLSRFTGAARVMGKPLGGYSVLDRKVQPSVPQTGISHQYRQPPMSTNPFLTRII